MSFDDFIKHFVALNVCKTKDCNEIRLKGKFVRLIGEESSAKNPCSYVLSKWIYSIDVK